MVEGGRGGADKIFKPDREALCVPELHSSSSLLLAVGRRPASVLAGRPGRSGIRPRRRASACTSGDIERASTMIPAMEIIQAIGFEGPSGSSAAERQCASVHAESCAASAPRIRWSRHAAALSACGAPGGRHRW